MLSCSVRQVIYLNSKMKTDEILACDRYFSLDMIWYDVSEPNEDIDSKFSESR